SAVFLFARRMTGPQSGHALPRFETVFPACLACTFIVCPEGMYDVFAVEVKFIFDKLAVNEETIRWTPCRADAASQAR
ncbi:MAG: hypothetical protein RID22_03345, partial [Roseibium aggregatum]